MAQRDGDQQVESRRILDRISKESDASGQSLVGRTAARARRHLAAEDADQNDWAEYWGTRIGRLIAMLFTGALILWLLLFLVRGS